MARTATKTKPKLYHATMHVTRTEQWCIEADSAEEARAMLAAGQGHRCDAGECMNAEVVTVQED